MGYPDGIGAIDLMIGFPFKDKKATYDYLRAGIKDTGEDASVMPAGYMFKDTPDEAGDDDPVEVTFGQMDTWGVSAGLFSVNENSIEAKKRYPNRVFFSIDIDPNDIPDHREGGFVSPRSSPGRSTPVGRPKPRR